MLFDGLILLHRGKLCYFGPGRDKPCEFFGAQGFAYRSGWNVAEYLLHTIANGARGTACSDGDSIVAAVAAPDEAAAAETGTVAAPHDFAACYAASELCAKQKQLVDSASQTHAARSTGLIAGLLERRAPPSVYCRHSIMLRDHASLSFAGTDYLRRTHTLQ